MADSSIKVMLIFFIITLVVLNVVKIENVSHDAVIVHASVI